MAIEIVDLPIKNGGSFHSYVSLPEGNRHYFFGIDQNCHFLMGPHDDELAGWKNQVGCTVKKIQRISSSINIIIMWGPPVMFVGLDSPQ